MDENQKDQTNLTENQISAQEQEYTAAKEQNTEPQSNEILQNQANEEQQELFVPADPYIAPQPDAVSFHTAELPSLLQQPEILQSTEPVNTPETPPATASFTYTPDYSQPVKQPPFAQVEKPVQPVQNNYAYTPYPPVYQPYQTQQWNTGQNQIFTPVQKKNNGLRVFNIILSVILLMTLSLFAFYYINNDNDSNSINNTVVDINQGVKVDSQGMEPDKNGMYTTAQAAKIVAPSVVGIFIYSSSSDTAGYASGVILNEQGYILTNDHIYSSVPGAVFLITLSDGREFDAVYIAGDQKTDIAVIKITNPKDLKPAVFADSDTVTVGEQTIAIGNPHGLKNSVTAGIVSSANRRISTGSSQGVSGYSNKFIQTDTAINQGNSGGALVNMYGQVIGINSMKFISEGMEGLGFAIPSNIAVKNAKSLIEHKYVADRGRLGISYTEVDTPMAKRTGKTKGLEINDVSNESSLFGKISKNDTIVKIDGQNVNSSDVVLDIIESKKPGDTIEFTLYSAAQRKDYTVTGTLIEDRGASSYVEKQNNDRIPAPGGSS